MMTEMIYLDLFNDIVERLTQKYTDIIDKM